MFIIPALVKLHTSKSCTLTAGLCNMYLSGSAMNFFLLFPTPLVAIFNQNKFNTDTSLKKTPCVLGPAHAAIKDNIVPICNSTGVLFCLLVRSWYLYTMGSRCLSQSKDIAKASSYKCLAV